MPAGVIGNRRSHLYHAPNCRGATATSEKNRVAFKSSSEAEAAEYKRAGNCLQVVSVSGWATSAIGVSWKGSTKGPEILRVGSGRLA